MSLIYKATLLDSYYKLRGESALPNSDYHFQFGKFRMGSGFLIDDGEGNTVLDAIPSDTAVLPNVFYTGDPTITYADGRTAIACPMPAGTIDEDATVSFSCVGIYDLATDTLIAVMAGAELTLTHIDELDISSYIDNILNQ